MKTQRKMIAAVLLLIGLLTTRDLSAQCTTYNFSSAAGWTQVGTGVSISAGQVNFAGAADGGAPRYVYTTFTPSLSNTSWYCDFEFTPVSGNGPAHTLIAFTTSSPFVPSASGDYTTSPFKYSNMNCIEVALLGPAGNTNVSSWGVYARAKQFNPSFAYGYPLSFVPSYSQSSTITLPASSANVKRYMRIQRLDATRCKLSMYSDAARTALIGSSCFTIPSGITGLNAVQVGNQPEGSSTRTFNGNVDNITFCNLNPALTGPSPLCANTSGIYKLSNGNSSVTANNGFPGSTGFTWSAPAGSTLGNGTGGANFTSGTGNGSQNGISLGSSGTVSCVVNYGCATVTYNLNVTSTPLPTSSFTNTSPYCSNEAILVNGTASTNETSHQWSLATCTSAGVVTGPWNSAGSVSGAAGSANLTSLLPTFFPCPAYYKIRLVTSNSCASVNNEQVIMVSCLPNVTAGTSTFLCPGGCTVLTSSGASTYSWSPAAGLSSTTVSNPTACPASTTTYIVTGAAPGCPSDAASVTLTVSTLTASAGPDIFMCCNLFDTLEPVISGGTPPYTVTWSPATDLFCPGVGPYTPGACTDPVVRTCTSNSYTLTVTDAAGCTVTDVMNVVINCRTAAPGSLQTEEEQPISVYPNPASNELLVNTGSETAKSIQITDVAGRTVLQIQPLNSVVNLNTSELPEGVYLIRIETNHGIETREIVISR
jgi:Secretion system C-terminal sorting domain